MVTKKQLTDEIERAKIIGYIEAYSDLTKLTLLERWLVGFNLVFRNKALIKIVEE